MITRTRVRVTECCEFYSFAYIKNEKLPFRLKTVSLCLNLSSLLEEEENRLQQKWKDFFTNIHFSNHNNVIQKRSLTCHFLRFLKNINQSGCNFHLLPYQVYVNVTPFFHTNKKKKNKN